MTVSASACARTARATGRAGAAAIGQARWRTRLVAVVASATLISGCGNAITTEINGMTGVTVDEAGGPLVVAELCDGVVAGVTIAGPNRGAEPNEIRAELTAAQPVETPFVLDPISPPEDWTGQALDAPLSEDVHIAFAHGGNTADSQLSQATFTLVELSQLQVGTVQYGSHDDGDNPQRVDAAAFAGVACPGKADR